jgi:hypothetical protein
MVDMLGKYGLQRRTVRATNRSEQLDVVIQTLGRQQAEFDNLAAGQVDRPQGDPEGVSAQRE